MLPEVVGHGYVSLHIHQVKTTEKRTTKGALKCVRSQTTLQLVCSILTYAHIPSPHWRQGRKSQCDVVEITLNKLALLSSVRLPGRSNGAKPEDTPTVTPLQYYADKQITLKPRHNSHGEMPYEKPNFVSKYPDNYKRGGTGVGCCITFDITASGDGKNSRISVVDHLNVMRALLLQTTHGIRYSNENIARKQCDDMGDSRAQITAIVVF